MKSFWEWRNERRARKEARALLEYILSELDRGVSTRDLFVYNIENSVLWNKENGFWYVECAERLDVGQKIKLLCGRGGAVEEARIVAWLGGDAYSITYDLDMDWTGVVE